MTNSDNQYEIIATDGSRACFTDCSTCFEAEYGLEPGTLAALAQISASRLVLEGKTYTVGLMLPYADPKMA